MKLIILFILTLLSLYSQETKPAEQKPDEVIIKRLDELEKTLKQQTAELEEIKKNPPSKTSETKGYVSPMKKDGIAPDYLRSLLLEPEIQKQLGKNQSMWLNDVIRMGVQIRPRTEHRSNTDFNKNTDDYVSRQTLGSQIWFLFDPHPNITAKVTIQDSRAFGGSGSAPSGDDRKYFFDATGTTINPQTYSSNSNCPANTSITNSNFNTCLSPNEKTQTTVRDSTSIREAFMDLKNFWSTTKIRIGRQILSYGDQRIIGGANWLQNGLSFDGVRVSHEHSRINNDLFAIKVSTGQNYLGQQEVPNGIQTQKGRLNGSIDDAYLAGTYNTLKIPELGFNVDLYSVGLFKKWIPSSSPTYSLPNATLYPSDRSRQNDELFTHGFRFTNRTKSNSLPDDKSFDWTAESSWQTGTTGQRIGASWDPLQTQHLSQNGTSIRNPYITETTGNIYNQAGTGFCGNVACSGNANTNLYTEKVRYTGQNHIFQLGYTFIKKIRLGGQYIFSSGNSNRTTGSNSTYQTLANPRFGSFPIWNNFSGVSETLDIKNVKSYSGSISYRSAEYGFFQIAYFIHQKAAIQDAWYGISGTANSSATNGSTEVRNGNPYTTNNNPYLPAPKLGKNLYHEIDLSWLYNWNEHVSFWFGAAYLTAGDAIKNQRNQPITVDKNNSYIYNPAGNSFKKNATVVWFMVTTVF